MKHAVCIIIPTSRSRYFAVSRRGDTSQWGFPGGKVDPGESHCEAILRETREEIGIELLKHDIVPIFSALCKGKVDGVDYWVTTYLSTIPVSSEKDFKKLLKMEPGLTGAFLSAEELCSEQTSPFNEYNVGAVAAMRLYLASGHKHSSHVVK